MGLSCRCLVSLAALGRASKSFRSGVRCRLALAHLHAAEQIASAHSWIRERSINGVSSLTLHVCGDVRVQVECYGNRGMSEHFGSHLWMNSAAEHKRGSAMAQVMESDGWKSRSTQRSS